jgi:type IX secretion system PorP/SprF family membrane protein
MYFLALFLKVSHQISFFMKRILTIAALCTALSVQAQLGSPSYLYNQNLLNPAYIALNQTPVITSSYGYQWAGVQGAPQAFAMNLSTKIKQSHGVEVAFNRNSLGWSQTGFSTLAYSYALKLNDNVKLSIGARGGVFTSRIGSNWNGFTSNTTKFGFQTELGGFLEGKRAFIGMSYYNNLFEDKSIIFVSSTGSTYNYGINGAKVFNTHSGVNFNLGKNVVMTPSTLISVGRGAPIGTDLNLGFNFNEKVKTYFSYSLSKNLGMTTLIESYLADSFNFGGSVRFFKRLDIGYIRQIYFLSNNNRRLQNPNSNQFFLRFAPKKKV